MRSQLRLSWGRNNGIRRLMEIMRWRKKSRQKRRIKGEVITMGVLFSSGLHRARECPKKEVMNTLVIQGKKIRALLDTCASSNFLAQHVVDRLGVNISFCNRHVNAMNSSANDIYRVVETNMELGSWKGTYTMNVIALDDFKLILGIEFFEGAKMMLMSHLRGIVIGDGKHPCFIRDEESLNKQERKSYSVSEGDNKALENERRVAVLEIKPSETIRRWKMKDVWQFLEETCNCPMLRKVPKMLIKYEGEKVVGHVEIVVGRESLGDYLGRVGIVRRGWNGDTGRYGFCAAKHGKCSHLTNLLNQRMRNRDISPYFTAQKPCRPVSPFQLFLTIPNLSSFAHCLFFQAMPQITTCTRP
ncbi:hypothetical protein Dsin_008473 [Dipteronia sinensis]|uniref:Uncharacterized protein n=1 Tax=Dipteronia sinensis TaxID=43782 RepID=A0AAE0AP91_9ROSI|nr:hypothetical protein Dsin_008473 [Dipteronia sinensis]